MLKVFGGVVIGLGWLGLTTYGLVKAARYDARPTPLLETKSPFPSTSLLKIDEKGTTAILFVHPACPCSKATMHALEEAQARASRKATIYVVFARAKGLPANAELTALGAIAKRIERTQVIEDINCTEADRFGATVSGQCFVYFPDGSLQFSGGLTRARGHYGSNDGSKALLSLMNGYATDVKHVPVFGCSLR